MNAVTLFDKYEKKEIVDNIMAEIELCERETVDWGKYERGSAMVNNIPR